VAGVAAAAERGGSTIGRIEVDAFGSPNGLPEADGLWLGIRSSGNSDLEEGKEHGQRDCRRQLVRAMIEWTSTRSTGF
jgi:hypothetical protein